MNHIEIQELTLKEEMSPIRQMLKNHRSKVLGLTNYFVLLFMITFILQRIFFHAKVDAELDLHSSFQAILQQIIVMIAILIALDPEADALAFQSSLVNFNR